MSNPLQDLLDQHREKIASDESELAAVTAQIEHHRSALAESEVRAENIRTRIRPCQEAIAALELAITSVSAAGIATVAVAPKPKPTPAPPPLPIKQASKPSTPPPRAVVPLKVTTPQVSSPVWSQIETPKEFVEIYLKTHPEGATAVALHDFAKQHNAKWLDGNTEVLQKGKLRAVLSLMLDKKLVTQNKTTNAFQLVT